MNTVSSHLGTSYVLAVLAVAFAACGGSVVRPESQSGDDGHSSSAGDGDGHVDGGPSSTEAGAEPSNGFWSAEAGASAVSNGCTGQYPAHYALVRTTTLPSPLASPSGMTFDGEDLWLVSSASSGPSNAVQTTIVRLSADSGLVDRTFVLELPGSDAPGAVVGGLAWDGHAIWTGFGSSDGISIFRIDPTTGEITQTTSTSDFMGTIDLAFDGTDLWMTSGGTDAFRLDSATGEPLEHFGIPGGVGIAIRPCEVWVGDDGNLPGSYSIFDPATGQEVSTVITGEAASVYHGQIAFMANWLVVADSHGISRYEMSAHP
jgi:hypothetical protein